MKTLILAAIRCSLIFLLPTVTYAISAQWDLDPISGDWNTAANWTPNGIPNGPADVASFSLSHTTDVSISANTEVNSIIFTPAATSPYSITANPGLTLTISGAGITNNSGTTQTLATADDASGNFGTIAFSKSATAGSNVSIFNEGGSINFFNSSTAGGAVIENDYSGIGNTSANMYFFNNSNAGDAHIINYSSGTEFFNSSSAGNATIDTQSANVSFHNNSTAGSAVIGICDNCNLLFSDTSTAANASIHSSNFIEFSDSSTAGNATIRSSGFTLFDGSSRGGTAQIEIASYPFLGIFGSLVIDNDVTIGSLAGDEGTNVYVYLASNLTIGSNNLSTTVSGVIQGSGSLTKIGTGTLDLTGANTYLGNTNINRGVLLVDGSITSNTFVNHRGTLAGTGTIQGNVVNSDFGTVRPGGTLGTPGMLTIAGNYTQTQYATLMIQIAGTTAGEFSVLNVLGSANLNGFLNPVLLDGFVPTIGDSFVFLNYASFTGAFSHIKHQVFDNGMLQWSVIYENNDAILTVGPNTIPDQGSTFLLLTLGLLGLLASRRHLLRKQP